MPGAPDRQLAVVDGRLLVARELSLFVALLLLRGALPATSAGLLGQALRVPSSATLLVGVPIALLALLVLLAATGLVLLAAPGPLLTAAGAALLGLVAGELALLVTPLTLGGVLPADRLAAGTSTTPLPTLLSRSSLALLAHSLLSHVLLGLPPT